MGWQPDYRTEAQIYAKHMLANVKEPKLGILYQNDDFGKDYPIGMRDVLGDDWDKIVIEIVSYETTDPTIDLADRRVAGFGRQRAAGRRYPEVRRAVDPQGARAQLEADVLHDQCVDLGGRRDHAGRAGKGRSACSARSI